MRRQGRKPSSSCSKSSGHNFIHNVSLNCYRDTSVSGMSLSYHSLKKWERLQRDGITWALCQSRIPGDVTRYHAKERCLLSVGPKLSHSCFFQCLLYDEGFSEMKILEKTSFPSRIIYARARTSMSAVRVTALYSWWWLYVPQGSMFKSSTFYPKSAFICFLWILEQIAIMSIYVTN